MSNVNGVAERPRLKPTGQGAFNLNSALDLRSLLSIFRQRWKLFASVLVIFTVAAIGAALIAPPSYSAQAVLKVDPNKHAAISVNAASAGGGPPDTALVDTEVTVIQSRQVAMAVVKRMKLTEDPEFRGKGSAGRSSLDETTDNLMKALKVQRDGLTYIIDVRVTSGQPDKSAALTNAVVDEYLNFSRQSRAAAADDETRSLNERLGTLGSDVQAADQRLATYRTNSGIVSGTGNAGTVTDQQITTIAGQLALAQAQSAAARSKANAARSQVAVGNINAVSEVLSSPVIIDLRRQRTEVVREQAQISAKYGARHPDFIRVTEQINQLDKQIADEAGRIVSGLESDARATEAQTASLAGNLSSLKAQQSGNAQASVLADSLERDAEAKRNIFNQINQAAQASAQLAQLGDIQARVVALATPPTKPSFPNKPLFALLGLVIGGVAGAAGVLVAETLDSGVRRLEDLEQGLGLPCIGSIQRLSARQMAAAKVKTPWNYVLARPVSGFAESLRTARTAVLTSRRDQEPLTIAVTSAIPSEGKTVTAISLARIMAMSGDKVILVDCDLRRSSASELVTDRGSKGLVEVLTGTATLEETIKQDVVPGLDVLPLAELTFTPRDLFSGEPMQRLLAELKTRYTFVVLDAPPALVVADAQSLAGVADRAIMIVRWGTTSRFAVETTKSRLEASGANVIGAIVTLVAGDNQGALGERSGSYYYKQYGRYYVD